MGSWVAVGGGLLRSSCSARRCCCCCGRGSSSDFGESCSLTSASASASAAGWGSLGTGLGPASGSVVADAIRTSWTDLFFLRPSSSPSSWSSSIFLFLLTGASCKLLPCWLFCMFFLWFGDRRWPSHSDSDFMIKWQTLQFSRPDFVYVRSGWVMRREACSLRRRLLTSAISR